MDDEDFYSKVKNSHDVGIVSTISNDIRPEPQKNLFRFFSTISPDLLMNGIDVNLDMSYTPLQCKHALKSQLQKYYKNILNMDLLIYLAGGIPFLGGTLGNFYDSKSNYLKNVKKYIYGVLIYQFPDKYLDEPDYQLHNINDELNQKLISPFCESSLIGLCDMSCLLGYLSNFGPKSEKLLSSLAVLTRFPPLITSLNRFIDRNNVTHRDILTICSTLYTYFKSLIKAIVNPENIFEHALKCCNMIIHIDEIPDYPDLFIDKIDIKDRSKPNFKFLNELNQPEIAYFWKIDTNQKIQIIQIEKLDPKAIDDANKSFVSFKPIAPLSIRSILGCSIVKGKDHSFLYLGQSSVKAQTDDVVIFDPTEDKSKIVNIDEFAKSQGNSENYDVANLIDPDKVEQIIMVCFDRSDSMNWNLNGDSINNLFKFPFPNTDDVSRLFIAKQYLTSFANKFYAYRIPCLLGLMSFNKDVEIRCHLSPLIPDFETKGLDGIESVGGTAVWDAISLACDELVKCTKDSNGKPIFKKAKKRILVISDGEDTLSKTKSFIVAKKLIQNKIILDTVIISSEDCCKELASIAHISGGLALKPNDIFKGLDYFEMSAFQNYNERKKPTNPIIKGNKSTIPLKTLTEDMITEDFIQQAIEFVKFDTEIINPSLVKAKLNSRLATPDHICSVCTEKKIKEPRRRRILRELHYAAIKMNKDSCTYDPDIIIYPSSDNLDIWQAYIKAPSDLPYKGKWFFILVTFPVQYPIEAPVFQFISVPYNLNISTEGRICINMLEKGYIPSYHVVDILQQIKEIFLFNTLDLPISINILYTYLHDRDEYNRLAEQSADKVGKDNYEDFFPQYSCIIKDVSSNWKPFYDNDIEIPSYMKSQISGRVYQDPVMPHSCNQIYEREELIQLVSQNQNPTCIVSGIPITETLDEILQLDTISIH